MWSISYLKLQVIFMKSNNYASRGRYFSSRNFKWSINTNATNREYEKQIVYFMGRYRFMDFEGNFNHAIMIRTF
jgi:hypothetical protein